MQSDCAQFRQFKRNRLRTVQKSGGAVGRLIAMLRKGYLSMSGGESQNRQFVANGHSWGRKSWAGLLMVVPPPEVPEAGVFFEEGSPGAPTFRSIGGMMGFSEPFFI